MDLAPFKMDIDELLTDYAKENGTAFTDFKRVWMAKKFSYIYVGRPKMNSGVFMQSLFLHCIGRLWLPGSWSYDFSKYSLYHKDWLGFTAFTVFTSANHTSHISRFICLLGLKKLKDFIVEAKQNGMSVVPVLVKRMLDKGMFLFGFINLLGDLGRSRLFVNTKVESYMHMDLDAEFELDNIKKLPVDYAKAKELAFAEANQIVDVEDAKHILQNDKLLGDRVEEIVKEWDAQKEEFYEKTGASRHGGLAVVGNDELGVFHHANDGFDEITRQLLE